MTTPVPSANEAFLRLLFRADWHRVSVCSVADLKAKGWPARAARDAFPLDPKLNNYFCVSLVKDPAQRRKTGFEALCVLVLDDVGPKGDPVEIRAALGEPTYRLRTSPLNEQWGYRLDPWIYDRTRAERLLKRVVANHFSGKDPGMAGVVRIMRLPEGTNNKAHLGVNGFPSVYWAASGAEKRTITAEMVEAACPLPDDKISSGGPAPAASSPAPDPVPAPVPGHTKGRDPVLEAMWRLGLILGGPRQTSQGVAWDIICPWSHEHTPGTGAENTGTAYFRGGGFRCWHGHCDNRHPADVRTRMDELIREDSGGLMGLDDLDPHGSTFGVVDPATVPPSPVKATPVLPPIKAFMESVVFLTTEDRWLDLTNDTTLNDRALNKVWLPRLRGLLPTDAKGREITPSAWARGSSVARDVDARTWWPGKPLVFTAITNGMSRCYVNTWRDIPRPLAHVPLADLERYVLASDWWALAGALMGPTPEGIENLRRLRNYMAMIVGAVHIKPANNPLIIGPQGAGKEQIWAPLVSVLGPERALSISQAMFNSEFNPWALNRLVLMPEVRRTTRGTTTDHDQYQAIKRMCDAGRAFDAVNQKYMTAINAANAFVLVMTSNEDRPMTLPEDDRRIWVIYTADTGWTVDRHQKLAAWFGAASPWGATNNDAVVEYLIRYWDEALMLGEVQGHAPMTQNKRHLIKLSGGPVLAWLNDRLDLKPPHPLALHDLLTAHELVDLVEAALRSGDQGLPRKTMVPTTERMGRLMVQAGCQRLNQGGPVQTDAGRRVVWAHRDTTIPYDKMTGAALGIEWDKLHNRRAQSLLPQGGPFTP
jgi:hypothetical protein